MTPDEYEIEFLEHVVGILYEALGPANDDVLKDAYDDWIANRGELPDKYKVDYEERFGT